MKNVILNVPDDRAEEFAAKLAALMKDCGVSVAEKQEYHEEYDPEEGEFVTAEDGESKATAIFIKFVEDGSVFTAYACLDSEGKLHMRNDDIPWDAQGLRPATDEEKERLEKELAKVGQEWDPYDCEFVECETYKAIRTFEDAMMATGMTFPIDERTMDLLGADTVAYMKLRVICAAINGLSETTLDEFPKFTTDEYRYYPWFNLYTQEEIDRMDEDDKAQLLFVGGDAYVGSLCGLSCACSNYAFSFSIACFGARLAFKTRERAEYAGRQFIELYAALNFIPSKKEVKE